MNGTVSYFNFERKYGFIQDSDGGELYFNVGRICENAANVRVGSAVTFDIQPAPVGRRLRTAANIIVGVVDRQFFGKMMLAGTAADDAEAK